MKKLYFISLLFAFFLYGCKSEFEQFNEQSLTFATNDKSIDKKEYENLLEQISLSNEKGFQQFKDDKGKIDNAKVVSYLKKYFSAKNLAITAADIWQPENTATKADKFNINVFLENSASMDGYVKGVSEFETAIYNLLGDFKISGVCDSMNLSYINKNLLTQKKNALAPDIQDFIEKLEPSTFKQRGGDRSVSDLKNILNTVLKTVNNNNVAVLISDFVFSPGNKTDAQDYLNNQGVGIKIDFASKLSTFDLSAVVIQLNSRFNGLYYDKMDTPIPLKCKRPYYIWIIGNTKQISKILKTKMLDNIKGGYQNLLVFQKSRETNQPDYKILLSNQVGSFRLKEGAKGPICDSKKSDDSRTKGLFGFTVAVDFSNSLQDENYFTDTANFMLSNPKYSLKIEKITDKQNLSLSGFTHKLIFQTKALQDETLKIDVVGKVPSWVYESNSDDDASIAKNDTAQKQKTFGFKYLVEGVSDAFYPKSNAISVSSFNITIIKN